MVIRNTAAVAHGIPRVPWLDRVLSHIPDLLSPDDILEIQLRVVPHDPLSDFPARLRAHLWEQPLAGTSSWRKKKLGWFHLHRQHQSTSSRSPFHTGGHGRLRKCRRGSSQSP